MEINMPLETRTQAFVQLGKNLTDLPKETWQEVCRQAKNHNTWFDETSLDLALKSIIRYLQPEALQQFVAGYDLPIENAPKSIGVIMAGNIPLAGFHDYLMVLLSGNALGAKLSSQDPVLLKFINSELAKVAPELAARVTFTEQLKSADAIIATGSNNSARYFEQYFSRFPHIIRKNRTGLAVLKGNESEEAFKGLAEDLLIYYGLGCRNVSKVLVPEGYDFSPLLKALETPAQEALQNHKYSNNYDYNRSIYLVNKEPHFDNGFIMFRESEQLVSPISVVYFQQYRSEEEVGSYIKNHEEDLQCLVSENGWLNESFPFGKAQEPEISDFADHVDTMKFLLSL